jgi:hypothetical protein
MNPAVFGLLTSSLGALFLTSAAALAAATHEDTQKLVAELHGDAALKPQCVADGDVLVDAHARAALISHLDSLHAEPRQGAQPIGSRPDDLVVGLSEIEARTLLGAGTFERLCSHFGAPVDVIKLRRASAIGKFVPFHTDYSLRTMQVALNDDFKGGQLVFATGEGFLVPPRPAGTATVHESQQVHGVAKLEAGVRYGLFLCHTGGEPDPAPAASLNELVAPALAELAFFEEALPWLSAASEADLLWAVTAYASFLRAAMGASRTLATAAPSLPLEVAWRTHMLNPAAYLQACGMVGGGPILDHDPSAYPVEGDSRFEATRFTTATAGPSASLDATDVAWLGLQVDLVAALRRQASFMRRALDRKAELTAGMMAASGEYWAFLIAASQAAPGTLEPTLAVDLLWHAHMGFPRKYAQDCVRLTGMLLHHDDEPRHVRAS